MEAEEKLKSRFKLQDLSPFILVSVSLAIGIVLGSLLTGVVTDSLILKVKEKKPQVKLTQNQTALAILGKLTDQEANGAEDLIREQIRLIVSKPQFFDSLEVVKKHQETIQKTAEIYQIPTDVALGIALLENGGSETAVSSAGAAGIFQLTESTANDLGLQVNDYLDERLEPEKNIQAGLSYLDRNLKLFSDIGLAVWAYHAGAQNVSFAVKVYLQTLGEKDAFDFLEAQRLEQLDRAKYVWRAYVTKGDLNVHRLLENPQVQLLSLAGLGDETQLYPYKIIAAAIVWHLPEKYPNEAEFKDQIKAFNQGKIILDELITPKEKKG